ncbi:MAG: PspA-associated protein PspAB [Dehalococcoidia bacterium]
MSSIQRFENGFDWINFFRYSKIMCWDNQDLIEEFSKRELKKIISEGNQGTSTKFKLINEPGEVTWVILEDENFSDLVSTTFTVFNALSQLINLNTVMGILFNFEIKNSESYSFLNNNHDYYLVFNQKPLGYYPLVYENDIRQPISELEILDLAIKESLHVNKNQDNWFGVENIPN